LSVTNLYKAAALDSDRIYREGYQDALEELLGFLDKENLGLQDGEGWSVRQWATERFEGSPAPNGSGESDDEHEDENTVKNAREASPVTLRRKASQELRPEPVAVLRSAPSHTRSESAPPITAAPPSSSAEPDFPQRNTDVPIQSYTVPQADFTFQSSHQYPHDMDMDAATDNNGTVHINVLPRGTRNSRQNSRALARQGSQLGHGAGMKRRMPNFDFFDLGGFNGKDGFGGGGTGGASGGGGGKRGRYS
jgi:hypothetical protein